MADTSTTKYYINGLPFPAPAPSTGTVAVDTTTTKYYLNGLPFQYPYSITTNTTPSTQFFMFLAMTI